MTIPEINEAIKTVDSNQVSDGYHTFGELYDHRITLFIALCRVIGELPTEHVDTFCLSIPSSELPWKSKVHSDGSVWDGWFIAGIGRSKGCQMSYHIPINRWEELRAQELDKAPEYDGHTPAQVLERIKKYLY